jgi:sugar phosphate isomerase/epimerase
MNATPKWPKISAFPKCYVDALSTGKMDLFEWIGMSVDLGAEGLEMYDRFFPSDDAAYPKRVRGAIERTGQVCSMLCVSPDFTHPDRTFRAAQVEQHKKAIDLTAALGASCCRVLSGQRRTDVSRSNGVRWVVESIRQLLPYAESRGVILSMENHYKDGFWEFPEFAQKADVFLEIVEQIDSPWFGVQYDPSNAVVAGDDPVALLERVRHRVRSMHASDRYLEPGTSLEEMKQADGTLGYPKNLHHGVVGRGMNDYDAIFRILRETGYSGWISIEDGVNGMDEMKESIDFLKAKITQYWGPIPAI